MFDGLIDDEVRKSFRGMSDREIYDFWLTAQKISSVVKPEILESDLSHAKIIRELGWLGFKEYLRVTVGHDMLDGEDIVALTEACGYLSEIEKTSLYAALFSCASEASSKKTVSARKKSYEKLTSGLDLYDIARGA